MVDMPVVRDEAWPPDETWVEVGYYDNFGACLLRGREAFEGEMRALLAAEDRLAAVRVEWTVVSSARRVERI